MYPQRVRRKYVWATPRRVAASVDIEERLRELFIAMRLTSKLSGRTMPPDQCRGRTLSRRARGSITEHHGPSHTEHVALMGTATAVPTSVPTIEPAVIRGMIVMMRMGPALARRPCAG
jgi:hypothetical protein